MSSLDALVIHTSSEGELPDKAVLARAILQIVNQRSPDIPLVIVYSIEPNSFSQEVAGILVDELVGRDNIIEIQVAADETLEEQITSLVRSLVERRFAAVGVVCIYKLWKRLSGLYIAEGIKPTLVIPALPV